MNRQKQQFERLVRETCQRALESCRERPDLFVATDNSMKLAFDMICEAAPKCGYSREELAELIDPELQNFLY